jgi:hypothetical protein
MAAALTATATIPISDKAGPGNVWTRNRRLKPDASQLSFLAGFSETMRGLFFGFLFCSTVTGTPAMAIEEPKYTVSLQEGAFEIRDYQAAIAAEVTVAGDQQGAASAGFRLLAGYIFGGNTRRQNIEMTAPVAQERVSEKIAMTAPVTQTPSEGKWVVRFTMPATYTLETLPEPNDPRIKLRKIPPARFLVLRFSGYATPSSVEARTAELVAFAKGRHLRMIGPVSLAQYNPPWTLWFMRRNEVMIPLEN